MKNPVYLIVLLALGLVFVSYKWATCAGQAEADDAKSHAGSGATVHARSGATSAAATSIENIMTRTSVRSYSDRAVSEGAVDTLLRAAMAAPTAGNKQPWRFVVIRDRKILDFIGEKFQSMTMMKKAQLAVVVCGDTNETFPGEGKEFWVQDASAATENLLLAAHAKGLGAVWCGVYPQSERVKKFSELLELPHEIIPLSCVAVGYPDSETTPKDKWNPEYIRYNTWNGKQK